MAAINKIHSTNMSLNDRFTAIATKPKPAQVRTRSRSAGARGLLAKDPFTSVANRRLLQQLVRKDNLRAALKLKRRSMRTAGGGSFTRANLRANNGLALRRGTVKALRVAANGRPIKTNSLSKVATMKADLVSAVRGRRPLARSDSTLSLNARMGTRRPVVGGAAQRVAQRRLSRGRGGRGRSIERGQGGGGRGRPMMERGRSRSRSRGRMPDGNFINVGRRGRSQSRNRDGNTPTNLRRGRSRSRSRSRSRFTANNRNLPVKSRLGVRPGTTAPARIQRGGNQRVGNQRGGNQRGGNQRGGSNRRPNLGNRGVAQGRVQKRNYNQTKTQGQINNNGGGRIGRTRGRSAARGQGGRSQSRNRRVSGGQNQQQQVGRRGRSQQRGRSVQRNGNTNANGVQQQQQRRGRSRSRGRGGRGGRNLGQNPKQKVVDRDALDKELDQYMATTKTENNVDYLLKN